MRIAPIIAGLVGLFYAGGSPLSAREVSTANGVEAVIRPAYVTSQYWRASASSESMDLLDAISVQPMDRREAVQVAAQSGNLGQFLGKVFDPIERTFEKLRASDKPAAKRRRARAPKKPSTPLDKVDAIKPQPVAMERVPVPFDRPGVRTDVANAPQYSEPSGSIFKTDKTHSSLAYVMLFFLFPVISAAIAVTYARNRCRHQNSRTVDEEGIYTAITRLDNDDADFAVGVRDVLVQVETTYRLRSGTLVALDPRSMTLQEVFASTLQDTACLELVARVIEEIQGHRTELLDSTMWRYPATQALPTGFLSKKRKRHADAILSCVSLGERRLVLLIGECFIDHALRHNDEHALHHITQLFALAIGVVSKKPEADLEGDDLQSAASKLAGRVAHEFKNILTSIAGYAEMAADALSPSSSSFRYIENIQKAGDRAREVIDQALDTGQESAKPASVFDAVAAAVEILPDLHTYMPSNVQLIRRFAPVPVYVSGSELKYQQMLVNLCKNAAEAIVGRGNVTLNISSFYEPVGRNVSHGKLHAGAYGWVSVVDTGSGISPDDLPWIFATFFTTKSSIGGTGLGLPMVHDTMLEFEGVLNVSSALGSGTRFDLYFPFAAHKTDTPRSSDVSKSGAFSSISQDGQPTANCQ